MEIEQIPERYRKRIVVDANGCWIWTGAKHRRGYGMINICRKVVTAHSFLFELLVGPVPYGTQLHHRCQVSACCNPDHLKIVTPLEHKRAHWRTHCLRGHELTELNTVLGPNGKRQCRLCLQEATRTWALANRNRRSEYMREWRQKNKEHIKEYKKTYGQ
jgi:hypothetical protein